MGSLDASLAPQLEQSKTCEVLAASSRVLEATIGSSNIMALFRMGKSLWGET